MRLTTLEIKGFKSFADKTTIHFNENITGVVGPNGCGKSNIVDAIRWVLGETKSSNLRTERMDNLVFNGTKKRKSSGMAQVSLTFENTRNILPTEYSTVTISRHYYRTGESEYRLNNVPCRLKDITSLFLDTGVSSDSYAIIELNMLGDLLHDKENSRRKLFEQAAGISKYKVRKRETLNKLKGTQADLDRVEDLLFEIEANLKELEKQARKAQRFIKIKDSYKEHSVEMAVRLLGRQKVHYQQITEQQSSEEDRRVEMEAQIDTLQAELEAKKVGMLDQEKSLSTLQTAFNERLENIRKQENDRNLILERLRFLDERSENLKREISDATQAIERFQLETVQLDKQRQAELKVIENLSEQLEKLNKDLEKVRNIHDEAQKRLKAGREELSEVQNSYHSKVKALEIGEVKTENHQTEIARINEQEAQRIAELQELTEQETDLSDKRRLCAEELEKLELSEEQLAEQLEKQRETVENASADLANLRRDLDAKQNEYQLTKSMIESMEGFPDSLRYLRKHVEQTQKAPLLSELISCKEEHKAALEGYLEPWLNHFVVPTWNDARAAIERLSSEQKGRAGFLVLEALDGQGSDRRSESLSASAQHARTLVEVDAPYEQLLDKLLYSAVLLTDEQNVSAQQRKELLDQGYDIIAASGQIVQQKNSIRGGSVGLFKGKRLGRARNLSKLEELVGILKTKEEQARLKKESELALEQELRSKSNREGVRQAARELEQASSQLQACRTRLESLQKGAGLADERRTELQQAIAAIAEENESLGKQIQDLSEKQSLKEAEVEEMAEEFQALSHQLQMATNHYNQQHLRFHQQKHQVDALNQELGFKTRRLEETASQQKKNEQLLESSIEEAGQLSTKSEELENLLLEAHAAKEEAQKVIQTAEESYFEARGEIGEIEENLRKLRQNREQVTELIGSIKDKLHELKLELNGVKERLKIEFDIDIEDLIDEESKMDISREDLEAKVAKLKKRIDNYGEINPMAVQAYEEMKTRYDFITEQKADLLEARDSLLNTIEEIDRTATDKFMEAFSTVRNNFIGVFRQLFREEDDCDLVLTDEDNPLESRIEIMAKPKGKRPTVIDQLSGGEKTLTAMALLFGLYLLKPAPFCVLDEVDAPLDDVNIGKFNDMIRRFAGDSQFIIVTHNKRTMERVDTIYGVTMQEQGISKVVPVDFRQWN